MMPHGKSVGSASQAPLSAKPDSSLICVGHNDVNVTR